jgi:hypothetical protein
MWDAQKLFAFTAWATPLAVMRASAHVTVPLPSRIDQ